MSEDQDAEIAPKRRGRPPKTEEVTPQYKHAIKLAKETSAKCISAIGKQYYVVNKNKVTLVKETNCGAWSEYIGKTSMLSDLIEKHKKLGEVIFK